MAITLTPAQQAALDAFEADAHAAAEARKANDLIQERLLRAQAESASDAQLTVRAMETALASGAAFIDAMLTSTPPATPTTPKK